MKTYNIDGCYLNKYYFFTIGVSGTIECLKGTSEVWFEVELLEKANIILEIHHTSC